MRRPSRPPRGDDDPLQRTLPQAMGRPTTAKQRNARTRFRSEGLRGSARPLLGQGSAERSRRPMRTRATCLSRLSNVIRNAHSGRYASHTKVNWAGWRLESLYFAPRRRCGCCKSGMDLEGFEYARLRLRSESDEDAQLRPMALPSAISYRTRQRKPTTQTAQAAQRPRRKRTFPASFHGTPSTRKASPSPWLQL